jgi:hypothetical protein
MLLLLLLRALLLPLLLPFPLLLTLLLLVLLLPPPLLISQLLPSAHVRSGRCFHKLCNRFDLGSIRDISAIDTIVMVLSILRDKCPIMRTITRALTCTALSQRPCLTLSLNHCISIL